MTRAELEALRREAKRFLGKLQALPGFAERRSELPAVPEAAMPLAFWSLRRLEHSDSTGKVEWRYFDEEALGEDAEALLSLEKLKVDGHPVEVRGPTGERQWRLPEYVAAPPDASERDRLEAYRTAAERFADELLLDAQWAPSALHDALRSASPVQLPQAPPVGHVRVPWTTPVVLDRADVWRREDLRTLGEALVWLGEDLQHPELPTRRDAVWTGALEGVTCKLQGGSLDSTQRGNRRRARHLLDAAVNGAYGLDRPADWAFNRDVGPSSRQGAATSHHTGDGGDGSATGR